MAAAEAESDKWVTTPVRIATPVVGIAAVVARAVTWAVRISGAMDNRTARVGVMILRVIGLADRLESNLAALGGNCERRFQAEGHGSFGIEDGGASARDEHAEDSRAGSDACSDGRAPATLRGSADDGAESRGADNGAGVASIGRAAAGLHERSAHGKNLTVNESELDDFNAEFGLAADASRFFHGDNAAGEKLSAARDNPAIGDERLLKRCAEAIADLIAVG